VVSEINASGGKLIKALIGQQHLAERVETT
jgi:hypothetical protein